MEVEIDQPTLSNHAKEAAQTVNPRTVQLIENVRSVETDRILEDPDPSSDRALDWIWATIDQLRLQSVIANDIVQTRYGEISIKDERCNLEDAIDQRLIAGTVLYQVNVHTLSHPFCCLTSLSDPSLFDRQPRLSWDELLKAASRCTERRHPQTMQHFCPITTRLNHQSVNCWFHITCINVCRRKTSLIS
jgi:hypothetical protein